MPRRWAKTAFCLLDALESPEAPETLRTLPCVATLRQLWQDHYERQTGTGRTEGTPPRPDPFQGATGTTTGGGAHRISYDVDARYRTKGSTQWTATWSM